MPCEHIFVSIFHVKNESSHDWTMEYISHNIEQLVIRCIMQCRMWFSPIISHFGFVLFCCEQH